MNLDKNAKEDLLCLARKAIEAGVQADKQISVPSSPEAEVFQSQGGAFVSVYVDNELRGCIGTFSEEESLGQNVKKMAVSAATTDARFKPILSEELDRLIIEISVLSPRTRIYDVSEIIIGLHGIYMTHGLNRGTLLPQVAVDQKWDTEEFLGNCSRYKAGIGWEGWKAAELYIYEAKVFRSSLTDKC